MDESALVATWLREEAQPFVGWDFSHIADRAIEPDPPWSYVAMARELLANASSALDLGTGGGEVLASLHDAFPPRVVATEAYTPNVAVARERLMPLGVTVVPYEADEATAPLPFEDGSFDAILSRHEAYQPSEVARVLAPGGAFLTQQVDASNLADLRSVFGVTTQWPQVTVDRFSEDLRAWGMVVAEAQHWRGSMTFKDVGAIVYWLKAIPWEVPGFSVHRHTKDLLELQRRLDRDGGLVFAVGRFVIRARKPATRT